jgi:hypothetical protein
MSKVQWRVLPIVVRVTLAGSPGGRVLVASTSALVRVVMASMRAFRLVSWERISALERGELGAGRVGLNMEGGRAEGLGRRGGN